LELYQPTQYRISACGNSSAGRAFDPDADNNHHGMEAATRSANRVAREIDEA
jgi:hypothetical protein